MQGQVKDFQMSPLYLLCLAVGALPAWLWGVLKTFCICNFVKCAWERQVLTVIQWSLTVLLQAGLLPTDASLPFSLSLFLSPSIPPSLKSISILRGGFKKKENCMSWKKWVKGNIRWIIFLSKIEGWLETAVKFLALTPLASVLVLGVDRGQGTWIVCYTLNLIL